MLKLTLYYREKNQVRVQNLTDLPLAMRRIMAIDPKLVRRFELSTVIHAQTFVGEQKEQRP